MPSGVYIRTYKNRFGKRVSLICEWCGNTFIRLDCLVKSNQKHFCGNHCRAKWIGNKNSNDLDYRERQRQLMKVKGNKPPVLRGKNHPRWKGGISKINRGQDYKYCQWRKDVLYRDRFKCQKCGIIGGKLQSHHIKRWVDSVELRYEINNGITYCTDCHMQLHGLAKFKSKEKL